MRSLVIATAVGAAAVSLAMSLVGVSAAYRRQTTPDAETHEGPQWIESGHREVLLDPSVTDERDGQTIYPAHVSADRAAVVDVQEVR